MVHESLLELSKQLFIYEKSVVDDFEEVGFEKIHFLAGNATELGNLVIGVIDVVTELWTQQNRGQSHSNNKN